MVMMQWIISLSQIGIPVETLSGFGCAAPHIRHTYKYKHLQAALSRIPHYKDHANVSTKASWVRSLLLTKIRKDLA